MEYNPEEGKKRSELLRHETTWMDFKGIMLSEKSQSQSIHVVYNYVIPFIQHSQITNYRGREKISGYQEMEKGVHKTERGTQDCSLLVMKYFSKLILLVVTKICI